MTDPIVVVYSEVSVDGKTTHRRGASSKAMMKFESAEVQRFRHELRAECDAIMVGSNTIRIDDPLLTVRFATGSNPLRVVPTSMGNIPLDSKILSDGGATLIVVGNAASDTVVANLQATGAAVVRVSQGNVDIRALVDLLRHRGVRSVMVEGGATLLASLFRANLVDRLIVQHLPVVFGGTDVPAMVGGEALQDVRASIPMKLVRVQQVGQHAIITYERLQD